MVVVVVVATLGKVVKLLSRVHIEKPVLLARAVRDGENKNERTPHHVLLFLAVFTALSLSLSVSLYVSA